VRAGADAGVEAKAGPTATAAAAMAATGAKNMIGRLRRGDMGVPNGRGCLLARFSYRTCADTSEVAYG
ncbi:MAG: hypothetical protein WAT42_01715, partial [Candidatus Nanopelagicales bacterium]